MENKLIRLEEQAYFQDEKLKELDERLLAQQIQMDALNRRLDAIGAALLEIREYLRGKGGKGDEKPPHYHNDPW
ncbi:MAG: SlyX family protein [Desulfovibrio sp.]|nr:SlyX family protein [Desulfovibrio sp.]